MGDTLLVITKFILGVLLLPVVWATAVVFHQHVSGFPGTHGEFFFWGVFGFLMLYLFFHQFEGMYAFGQKISSGFFQFTSPANRFIAKIVPFYLTLILLGFYVTTKFLDINTYDHYFMYFAGFAFTMHIILTAQDLQSDQEMFLKPEYLFTGAIVFILLIFGQYFCHRQHQRMLIPINYITIIIPNCNAIGNILLKNFHTIMVRKNGSCYAPKFPFGNFAG